MPLKAEIQRTLTALSGEVARACGFTHPPRRVLPRRGGGGDCSPEGVIRIGVKELEGPPDRLWQIMAHELAHAQSRGKEHHSIAFWRRLADGLGRARRLELLRFDIGYREGALSVAREFALADLPPRRGFALRSGDVVDRGGSRWIVRRRFRRGGQPHYCLEAPGWTWRAAEEELLSMWAGIRYRR